MAVRGEGYVSVIDPRAMRETRRIPTTDGVAMVIFRPDGKYAFVNSSRTDSVSWCGFSNTKDRGSDA